MNRKLFWAAAVCLIALAVWAANPSFSDFLTTQFATTSGNKVAIKSGVVLTNTDLRNVTQFGNFQVYPIAVGGGQELRFVPFTALPFSISDNGPSGFVYTQMPFTNGDTIAGVDGTFTGNFSLSAQTPSTVAQFNSGKRLVSVANGTGNLQNDGAGNLTWSAVAGGSSNITDSAFTAVVRNLSVSTNAAFVGPVTMSNIVVSTASNTNAPANNEFPVAGWVRSLFNNGILDYASTNVDVIATNVGSGQVMYTFQQGTIPWSGIRVYPTVASAQYIGSVITTNTFTFLQGPIAINAYLSQAGGNGGPSVTLHPELYYSYDKTNWYGDYDCANQNIPTGTNLYQFVISFPSIVSTNSAGFYLQRRFKIGTATGATTPTVTFHVGTNLVSGTGQASHIAFSGPNSGAAVAPEVTSVTVPMGAWYNSTGDGLTLLPATAFPVANTADGWAFTDGVTNAIRTRLALPIDWDSGTVQMGIRATCTGTNSSVATNIVLAVRAAAIGAGDSCLTPTFGTLVAVTNHISTNSYIQGDCITLPITVGNSPSTIKSVLWELQRLGADAGDTMTNSTVAITETRIFYRRVTANVFPTPTP